MYFFSNPTVSRRHATHTVARRTIAFAYVIYRQSQLAATNRVYTACRRRLPPINIYAAFIPVAPGLTTTRTPVSVGAFECAINLLLGNAPGNGLEDQLGRAGVWPIASPRDVLVGSNER
jgi:hypothetical protein